MDSDAAPHGSTPNGEHGEHGEHGEEEAQRDATPSSSPASVLADAADSSPSSEPSQAPADAPGAPPSPEPSPTPPTAPSRPGRCNLILLSFLSFCLICFVVWVVSAGQRYREEYAQLTEGWRVGTTRSVEVTLVPADRYNLACDSRKVYWGLHCGGTRDLEKTGIDPNLLQPYNTVGNKLFLGAGLWSSSNLGDSLPPGRFTVICNYHIKGVVKSARVRFGRPGAFVRLGKTVTAGTLTDCMIPQ